MAGLEAAHRAYGRLPWRELVVPAVRARADGVRLTRAQAHIHAILDLIIRALHEGRRVYSGPAAGGWRRASCCGCPISPTRSRGVAGAGRRRSARGERARATVEAVRDGGGS